MTAEVAIAVPVRNEAVHLPVLLDALASQSSVLPFNLFLFFDGCTDGGPSLATTLAAGLPFPIHVSIGNVAGPANAGLARRRACAAALAHMPHASLLTTDADSVPAADWVAASLAGLAIADIVAGRIEPTSAGSPLQHRLATYLDRLHRYRRTIDRVSWEDCQSHHWTSAASLAFRPGVYPALGGFTPLPHGEDADLGDRAWRTGVRLRRDACVTVTTSARRSGRVANGFAGLLASLDLVDAAPTVAHPADEAWRYRHHAWARRTWVDGISNDFAGAVRIDRSALERLVAAVPNAEAFTAHAVGVPPGGMRPVTISQAEAALAALDTDAMAEVA